MQTSGDGGAGALVIRCPLPRCGAGNPFDADECEGCGAPVRGHARLSVYAAYLFNRGLAEARAGRLASARDHFAAVVHWCPADAEARNALALAGYRLGDVAEARRQWGLVCERYPDDPLARRGLSLVAEGSG
ncbi:hypothetical protein E1264_01860 [Actinomadura sp. KC216]|uniref:hypothetical protein n=1 Tax=Actinomadura sp. KC216 TaxID=2530370 RepID=UPI00104D8BB7|nr:hypothetical protein [Actinomadura sp. KC216]TDB91399.1 hypothetical protein E1264_01860 [Actinomadura sp. KC216]